MQKILSVKEASSIVGLSVSTIYREIKAGRFPEGLNISKGRRGYTAEQLNQWMDSLAA